MTKKLMKKITLQDKKDIAKEFLEIFHLRIPWAHGKSTHLHQAIYNDGENDKFLNKKFPIDVNIKEVIYFTGPKTCWLMRFSIKTLSHNMEIDVTDYSRLFKITTKKGEIKNTYKFNDKELNKMIDNIITHFYSDLLENKEEINND